MAEVEQASLKSEQLSDKSSSPALPDDLSLDEHTAFQLLAREDQVCTWPEVCVRGGDGEGGIKDFISVCWHLRVENKN